MSRKLIFCCPCGFYCEAVRQEDALALIVLHVTRCHGDHMPFGITKSEAMALLREECVEEHKKKPVEHRIMLIQ